MSRIGKQPIAIPSGVSVDIGESAVTIKGPLGVLSQAIVRLVAVRTEDDRILVERQNDQQTARANHGLMRALLANMVTGVTQGFEKKLEINGVGYRADVRGNTLVMNLGFSHPVKFEIPDGIKIVVQKGSSGLTVSGRDRQQVGQVAAVIRGFRPPDRYKGKGVRYAGERISLKAGKSA